MTEEEPRDDFVPPHSDQAEASLLGTLLLWNDAQDDIVGLRSTDFYREENARIFGAIMSMLASGKTADLVTVFEHLRETGRASDLSYLTELTNSALSRGGVKRYCEIIVERSARRALLRHCNDINDTAYSAISTDDLLERANVSLSAISEGRTSSDPVALSNAIGGQLVALDERAEAFRAGRSSGITTGLVDLDRQLGGGFRPGELVIIAGRPAMGKTAMATAISLRQAKAGKSNLFCSQEMTNEENMNRLLSLESGVGLQSLRTGDIKQEDWSRLGLAADRLGSIKLFIDEQRAMRLMDVRNKARAIKRKHGLDVLVVDYLQLMTGEGENRTQEIGHLSRGLKKLAGELKITVVALSQLNRGLEGRTNKRPVLSDLRESGDIEADADIVLMLYRDEVYNESTQDKGVAEIIVSKQRNGPIGTVHASWKGDTACFDNLTTRPQPGQPWYGERE